MSTYRAATGHDIVLGSLTVLSPQPDPGTLIQTTRRTYAVDGTPTDQGRYIEFRWSALADASAYTTILTVFGLSASVSSALVTVYVRDEVFAWVRMNGTAIRPEPMREVSTGDRQQRPLDIILLVRNLETAS
jgi:hypothetical protein